jgi:hypothetical protein
MTYTNAHTATPSPRRRILAKLGGFLARAMPPRRSLLLALALLFTAAGASAGAQGYSRPTERVLSRAFTASGGSGWYLLRGWRETGRRDGVAYESWIDPLRYGLRTEVREPAGLAVHGFNGQADWRVGADGAITAVNDHASLAEARTEAFFAGNCFFFRGRFDARGDYLGVRRLGSRAYEVVRIQPWGGEPRELWFDQRSGLLGRIVDRTGRRAATLAVGDYRKVGPVLIAFRLTPEGVGTGDPLARQRESLVFAPLVRDRFSLNRPEELAKVAAARSAGRAEPASGPPPPSAASVEPRQLPGSRRPPPPVSGPRAPG